MFKLHQILSGTVFLTAFLCAVKPVTAQEDDKLKYVAAGIQDSRQKLSCFQVALRYKDFTPKVEPPISIESRKEDQTEVVNAQIYARLPLFYMELSRDSSNPSETLKSRALLSNGKELSTVDNFDDPSLKPKTTTYSFGSILAPENRIQNGLWKDNIDADPRTYLYYFGYTPLDEVLVDQTYSPKYIGDEKVEESQCAKVQFSTKGRKITCWVDLDHSFLIRRKEIVSIGAYTEGQELKVSEMVASKLLESNGVWFPSLIESTSRNWGKLPDPNQTKVITTPDELRKVPGTVYSLPARTRHIELSGFKATCDIPDETFKMRWPLGTNISDNFSQQVLVATAVTPEELKVLNDLRNQKELKALTSSTVTENDLVKFNTSRVKRGQQEVKDASIVVLDHSEHDFLTALRKKPNTTALTLPKKETTEVQ